jgi:hypothetical protein
VDGGKEEVKSWGGGGRQRNHRKVKGKRHLLSLEGRKDGRKDGRKGRKERKEGRKEVQLQRGHSTMHCKEVINASNTHVNSSTKSGIIKNIRQTLFLYPSNPLTLFLYPYLPMSQHSAQAWDSSPYYVRHRTPEPTHTHLSSFSEFRIKTQAQAWDLDPWTLLSP